MDIQMLSESQSEELRMTVVSLPESSVNATSPGERTCKGKSLTKGNHIIVTPGNVYNKLIFDEQIKEK